MKYPVRWDEHEHGAVSGLAKFNILLSLMRDSLINIQKAVKGQVVMSAELEELGNQLFVNRTPTLWKSAPTRSAPARGYIADQQDRLKFFDDWLRNKPPPCFWISGFSSRKPSSRAPAEPTQYTIPIDDVVFDYTMMKEEWRITQGPVDGVFTYGLLLEGARWDMETMELQESLPKVLFSFAPTMHWVPFRRADVPKYPMYDCPVYKTSDRRGVLATTGHSSNFVCMISMPSGRDQDHWMGGVAMLTQLDD